MKDDLFTFQTTCVSDECFGRTGLITTRRGKIETPVFMPVGTGGAVKTLSPEELESIGVTIILGNTYHLYLRPGTEILDHFGGIHGMMAWNKPILTDSGGFQVFSLKKLSSIDDEGVRFVSHLDGSRHFLTPEKSMEIQRSIGSEIMMVLDECAPFPIDEDEARNAMERSIAWAGRCRSDHPRLRGGQALFGIVQGSTFRNLRLESIEKTCEIGFEGIAMGGFSVGEPKELMYEVLHDVMPAVPKNLPRYLMGVGTPEDLLHGVEFGLDMFDCVFPTRIARHGSVFTRSGRINISAAAWRKSDLPIDGECNCYTCRTFSRGYIQHLFKIGEMLGMRLASLHNLAFLTGLMSEIRNALRHGKFLQLKKQFLERYNNREGDDI